MTNFGLEANLKVEASPEEIFDENSETSILTHMIKGVEVELKLKFWKELNKLVLKILENSDKLKIDLPMILPISPLFLLQMTGDINIKIDEQS